ncbi:family 20 glycosylhydrolase [Microbacterium sp. AGC85]
MSAILPLPQSMVQGPVLRALHDRSVRVDGASFDLAAIADLALRGLGIRIVSDADDPDVVLRVEVVDAPAPVGADPRPDGRSGVSEAYRIRPLDGRLVVSGAGQEALFRGLLTVLAAIVDDELPSIDVLDHPRFPWRGLSLDVVRRWFCVEEVERIIDLLALHKLNVLHIHLTDSQAWRFAVPGRAALTPDAEHYSAADLDRLVAYARERQITMIPEVDVPGHVAGSVEADGTVAVTTGFHPMVRYLEWDAPGVADLIRDALDVLTAHFDAPYLHLGGDEAFGAPHESFTAFLRAAVSEVRSRGRRVIGWQEAIRADAFDPRDLAQLWIADRDRFDADAMKSRVPEEYHSLVDTAAVLFAEAVDDPARIASSGVATIVSSSDPLYLDRRPSEPGLDQAQNERFVPVGNDGYPATPSTDVLRWDPLAQRDVHESGIAVAGIEAALWCETVSDFDDAALLLLPRLGFVAQRAWGAVDVDLDEVLTATRAQTARWSALGFANFYRSSEVFS